MFPVQVLGGRESGFPETPFQMVTAPTTYSRGREAMARALDEGHKPDVIICASDWLAHGAMAEVLNRGLRVPEDVAIIGHSIECRVNAENPTTFRPSPGKIKQYHPPGGLGVRIDSAVYQGYTIPPYYDSLVGKLIVHGKTRSECLMRLRRALDEMVVDGIETTLPLFRALVREPAIIDGDYHIHWLEQYLVGKASD